MIKFSKQFISNPAKIWISDITCSSNNLFKITGVFEYKWIVVTVDSIKEKSSLLTLMKNRGIKYFSRHRIADYIEISTVIPCTFLEDFLSEAIDEEPENIFILNLLDIVDCDMAWQRSYEDLVSIGVSNVFISISLDKNSLLICVNKSLLSPCEIFKKIKGLQFNKHCM